MDELLTTNEIMERLKIKRTSFDLYKKDLLRFGLFQINGPRSEYRMFATDFARYLESKKN